MSNKIDISAIVPVGPRFDRSGSLAKAYLEVLQASGKTFELIYVLDGKCDKLAKELLELSKQYPVLRVFQLSKRFGESTAVTAGLEHASGEIILTLPAYYQVDPAEITKLIPCLDDADMGIAVRWPRAAASRFEEIRRNLFHYLVTILAGERFRDLGCGVRIMKRQVLEEIPLYAEQHRFLPLLASKKGFRVKELDLKQSSHDQFEGRYGVKIYLQRLLDITTVFFLTRFMKKPLRLFGMVGSVTTLLGAIFLTYVVIERLFFGVDLADRPALLLSSLLVVLGLQLFALGLLGELIIFTHARDIKEYTVEEIVN